MLSFTVENTYYGEREKLSLRKTIQSFIHIDLITVNFYFYIRYPSVNLSLT